MNPAEAAYTTPFYRYLMATPTHWKVGDRVLTSRGSGVIVRIDLTTEGGIQHVATKLDRPMPGPLLSIGGEIEAEFVT